MAALQDMYKTDISYQILIGHLCGNCTSNAVILDSGEGILRAGKLTSHKLQVASLQQQ
jgi:hypothetical protein